MLYPLLFTIRIALSDYQIVQGNITFIGLENFKKVLSGGSRFWYAYRNNFLYALVTVPFILLGGMLFAYLINNLKRGTASSAWAFICRSSPHGSSSVWCSSICSIIPTAG